MTTAPIYWGLALALCANAANANCSEQVCISSTALDNGVAVYAHNQGPTPAVLEMAAELQNLSASPALPLRQELPPNDRRLITTLSRLDAAKGHRYAYRFSVRRLTTVEPCSGEVCIEGRPSAEGTTLVALNRTFGDVTLQVDADLKNLQAKPALPQLRVLAPRSETALATLTVQTVAQGHGYALRIQYVPGDVYARHDPAALYRLPYTSGSAHRVGQSYDGAFTHQGANRFAVDFNMPLGTPIRAARAGLVVDRKDDGVLGCPQSRCAPDGNFVRVRHADGTLAEYAHLQHRGVAVVLGQTLAVGQLLGYSGATGYASGPHLHFAVKKPRAINEWESLPITFVSRNGSVEKPVEGAIYTAQ